MAPAAIAQKKIGFEVLRRNEEIWSKFRGNEIWREIRWKRHVIWDKRERLGKL